MQSDEKYLTLLVEAQKKHCTFKRAADSYKCYFEADSLNVPNDVRRIIDAAEEAWYAWLKENITDKGFRLDYDLLGRPIGLLKVLAIQYADYE